MVKCKGCGKEAKYTAFGTKYCVQHYVETTDKEGIEASLYHDYIQDDPELLEAIKNRYPDLYKKYPVPFARASKAKKIWVKDQPLSRIKSSRKSNGFDCTIIEQKAYKFNSKDKRV